MLANNQTMRVNLYRLILCVYSGLSTEIMPIFSDVQEMSI